MIEDTRELLIKIPNKIYILQILQPYLINQTYYQNELVIYFIVFPASFPFNEPCYSCYSTTCYAAVD
jgi:hypothetical protein